METKVCADCGADKEVAHFQQKRTRNDGTKTYDVRCNPCRQIFRNGGVPSRRKSSPAQTITSHDGVPYKHCCRCKLEKPVVEFAIAKKAKTGYKSPCKECSNEAYDKWARGKGIPKQITFPTHEERLARHSYTAKRWAENNPTRVYENGKKWREKNPEKVKQYAAVFRTTHKEIIKGYKQKHYQANKEKVNASCKVWREANPEKARAHTRKWYYENIDRVRERALVQPSYAAYLVGGKIGTVPKELIEAKLMQLKLFRACAECK